MPGLNQNWLTETHIDFEYKKYVLLAYLSEVNQNFEEHRLYPYLAELVEHYRQLGAIRDNRKNLLNSFPKNLKQMDVEKFKLVYERIIEDDNLMAEIEAIVNFSMPKLEEILASGKRIYDLIEEKMSIQPIGLSPLYSNEGYLLLKDGKNASTNVYEFTITLFEQPTEKFRGIHTSYIDTYKSNLTNTFEYIKLDLVKNHKKLPNPATFAIETEKAVPLDETFLPIAKRMLVKYIAA